jgi:ribosomal protein S18 acetylase RimI-like enzyme
MDKTIFEVRENSELPTGAVSLLEKVMWGSDGARYTLTDIEPTLLQLPHSSYLTLEKDQQLIGLRMFLEKQAQWDSNPLQSFYHSFFAIDPEEKGKGYGKQLAEATVKNLRQKLGAKGLIYCHVEADNLRSLRIAESLGYQHIGDFSAMTFSRFFPKASGCLKKLMPAQVPQVLTRLKDQYSQHALTDFPLSFRSEDYYVLQKEGGFRAGVQVGHQRWKIHHLAGAGGAIALYALPRIPLLRDLFNPQNFNFLKFGNIFFNENHPEDIFELMEAVLAQHQLKTAMMFWDKQSPIYQKMTSAGRFGVLNTLTETPVRVMALFQGFDPVEIAEFRKRPKVISPSDI